MIIHVNPASGIPIYIQLMEQVKHAIEIGALYVPGIPKHALVALLIVFSIIKFALVVAFFMHLRYDNRILAALFVGPLMIAGVIILALMALFSAFILLARG